MLAYIMLADVGICDVSELCKYIQRFYQFYVQVHE